MAEFEKLLESADYDHIPSVVSGSTGMRWYWSEGSLKWLRAHSTSTDGAYWLLERAEDTSYWLVERRNATKTAYGKACLHLLKCAGYDDGQTY